MGGPLAANGLAHEDMTILNRHLINLMAITEKIDDNAWNRVKRFLGLALVLGNSARGAAVQRRLQVVEGRGSRTRWVNHQWCPQGSSTS